MDIAIKPLLLLLTAIGVYSVAEVKHTPTEYTPDVVIEMNYNKQGDLVVTSQFNEPNTDTCSVALASTKYFNKMLKNKKGCQIVLTTRSNYKSDN